MSALNEAGEYKIEHSFHATPAGDADPDVILVHVSDVYHQRVLQFRLRMLLPPRALLNNPNAGDTGYNKSPAIEELYRQTAEATIAGILRTWVPHGDMGEVRLFTLTWQPKEPTI